MEIDLIPGLILALAAGWAIGNYCTTFIFRLPRGEQALGGDRPFCDHCRKELETRDLFPVFSWFINRGKCRFCGAEVTPLHTVVELIVMTIFALAFLQYNYKDEFLLVAGLGASLVVVGFIEYQHGRIMRNVLVFAAFFAVMHRVLADLEIVNIGLGAALGGVFGYMVWKLLQKLEGEEVPQNFVGLFILAGIWFQPLLLVVFTLAGLLLYFLTRRVRVSGGRMGYTAAFSTVFMLLVLFPPEAPLISQTAY